MTPADMAAGIAPGPRTDGECGDGDAGTRSPLPKTRRTERVAVDPGPMPPRWFRRDSWKRRGIAYVHNTIEARVEVSPRKIEWSGVGDDEGLARDVADLLAWLRRGGR